MAVVTMKCSSSNTREKAVAAATLRPALVLAVALAGGSTSLLADDSWYPSRYGPSDTVGAANNLSADIVRKAAGLVTTGKVYSLAVDTGPQTPRIAHHNYQVVIVPRSGSGQLGVNQDTAFDDFVCTWQGMGTQLDGLGHHGIDYVHYNGIRAADIYAPDGIKKLSIHAVPPIVTRGVLLDMAKHFGVKIVKAGTVFNRTEIQAAAKRQNVELRRGDVVLLHTGWIDLLATDPKKFHSEAPGLGKDGARYLAGLEIVAVGADTFAVEVVPAENPQEYGPVHQILLTRHGTYLLENIDTRELSADGVSEFLFVLGQPRLVGAVQAIVNPIAIR